MSTILKALQRLEDEKSAGVERSLDEQVVSHPLPPDREPNRRGLKIGFTAIAGLAVAAAAFAFWPTREDPDAVVAAESTATTVAPVAAPAPEPAPAKRKVAAEKPRRRTSVRTQPQPAAREQAEISEAKAASIVEVVKRLDEPPAASPNRVAPAEAPRRSTRRPDAPKPDVQTVKRAAKPRPAAAPVADAKPVAKPKPEPVIAAKTVETVPAKPKATPPEPIEIAAVVPEPAPESIPAPAPREPEKRVVQRAKLPSLSIEKTIWHPDTDRRIAIVKMIDAEEVLRLKEGDAIGPLVVETIKPGSVLFNHDGIEIRYNVGG